MYPPCIEVNNYLIPETRKRVAKELRIKGFKEKEIAKFLHISQGMVSRYLNEKNSNLFNNEIDTISKELSRRISENYSEQENTEFFCNFCISFREKGEFCKIHNIKNCQMCMYLYIGKRRQEMDELSGMLKNAVNILSEYNISDLLPEVRMNIAYAREKPFSKMDVMAFPGRLTYVSGKLVYFSEPEFGASKHLSGILLNIKNKEIRAVLNLKYNEEMLQKIKENGLKFYVMDRKKYNDVENFVSSLDDYFDLIIDPGSFGIEPMVYIFGENPSVLVEKVRRLL